MCFDSNENLFSVYQGETQCQVNVNLPKTDTYFGFITHSIISGIEITPFNKISRMIHYFLQTDSTFIKNFFILHKKPDSTVIY